MLCFDEKGFKKCAPRAVSGISKPAEESASLRERDDGRHVEFFNYRKAHLFCVGASLMSLVMLLCV
ncbi:hypothetical protein LTR27_005567 [Elasticomyces elasticus]|nr:hypothetical protein LTR27_005567 [Elasticomyces elasticus]